MSDTKTFTVSGTDTEIKDIVSMGANPLDEETKEEEAVEEEEVPEEEVLEEQNEEQNEKEAN